MRGMNLKTNETRDLSQVDELLEIGPFLSLIFLSTELLSYEKCRYLCYLPYLLATRIATIKEKIKWGGSLYEYFMEINVGKRTSYFACV